MIRKQGKEMHRYVLVISILGKDLQLWISVISINIGKEQHVYISIN